MSSGKDSEDGKRKTAVTREELNLKLDKNSSKRASETSPTQKPVADLSRATKAEFDTRTVNSGKESEVGKKPPISMTEFNKKLDQISSKRTPENSPTQKPVEKISKLDGPKGTELYRATKAEYDAEKEKTLGVTKAVKLMASMSKSREAAAPAKKERLPYMDVNLPRVSSHKTARSRRGKELGEAPAEWSFVLGGDKDDHDHPQKRSTWALVLQGVVILAIVMTLLIVGSVYVNPSDSPSPNSVPAELAGTDVADMASATSVVSEVESSSPVGNADVDEEEEEEEKEEEEEGKVELESTVEVKGEEDTEDEVQADGAAEDEGGEGSGEEESGDEAEPAVESEGEQKEDEANSVADAKQDTQISSQEDAKAEKTASSPYTPEWAKPRNDNNQRNSWLTSLTNFVTGGVKPVTNVTATRARRSSSVPSTADGAAKASQLSKDLLRPGCTSHMLFVRRGKAKINPLIVQYTANRIKQGTMFKSPYEHIYIEKIFEPNFYKCILAHVPKGNDAEGMKKLRGSSPRFTVPIHSPEKGARTDTEAPADLNREFWFAFAEGFGSSKMSDLWVTKFRATTARRLTAAKLLGPWDATPATRTRRGKGTFNKFGYAMDLSRDLAGYNINPHTDTGNKWVTTLYYLPKTAELADAGTCVVRSKSGKLMRASSGRVKWNPDFELIRKAKYIPNSVMAFAPCYSSWHAVQKIEKPGAMRDTIQGFVHSSIKAPKGPCVKQ